MSKKVRIGIDVGGTFTDCVVLDNETADLIANEKIPTTHHHKEGVAKGIVNIIERVLKKENIKPEDVMFIAHGTTQATNALLEGDVATVGIIGMGKSAQAKRETNIGKIELASGKFLNIKYRYIESDDVNEDTVNKSIDALISEGVQVIVASESYSIENPENEKLVVRLAKEKGVFATGGYEISELYGLKARTRTAVVNGSLIPKMLETADMTEKVVKQLGIPSELMIMRADGGVMTINEMRKRPILTMLSGLAAGVAGALMYEKVTEGIFFEVGGTSVDISVIKDGKVMIKNAHVGGFKTYLKALDVRTLGIAGGSMIRIKEGKIIDVGPRSAHLAHKEYENFTKIENVEDVTIKMISPKDDDPSDYVILVNPKGEEYAYTLAGAANILGYIPQEDYAYNDPAVAKKAWEPLATYCGKSVEEVARDVMNIALEKVMAVVQPMIKEYKLDHKFVSLIGGGGSAAVLVPALGDKYNMKHKIANNAPYISTIGVAMAMIRETIERSCFNPTTEDIKKIRNDVKAKLLEAGAKEETIEITVEVDKLKNALIAIATGSTEFRNDKEMGKVYSPEELKPIVAESVDAKDEDVEFMGNIGKFSVYNCAVIKKKLFGLVKKRECVKVIADKEGVVHLRKRGAEILNTKTSSMKNDLLQVVDRLSTFSDAGQSIPAVYAIHSGKVFDYSGLQNSEQLLSMVEMDTQFVNNDSNLIMMVAKK